MLYLRCYATTPDTLKIQIETPGGTVEYDIPAIKSQQYTLQEIFDKIRQTGGNCPEICINGLECNFGIVGCKILKKQKDRKEKGMAAMPSFLFYAPAVILLRLAVLCASFP